MDWARYKVTLDNSTGTPPFHTSQIALDANGTFVAEVLLNKLTTSTFAVVLVSGNGAREKVVPETIAIRHWLNEPGGPVLTNSLGLAQADRTFAPMIAKGARLPATASETFQTTVALRRTDADAVIRIPIVEGERDRADRNLRVALIEIRPKDVRLDLPKGSDVEITFEVDESRRVTVVADVQLVDSQFDAVIDLSNVAPPDPDELQRALADVRQRMERLRESAERSGSQRAHDRLAQLDDEQMLSRAHDEVRAARTDEGAAAAADEHLRNIQSELDEVQSDVRLPALLAELTSLLDACREMVGRLGDSDDRAELTDLERRTEQARRDDDAAAVEALTERAAALQVLLLKRDGSFDVSVFYYFRENQNQLVPPGKAQALIREGERAIADQDWAALPGVNQRLRMLLPADLPDPADGGVQRQPGLGRRA